MRIALTIAGSDSGGGAGIQADLKTFQRFGVFGTSAVTAVTAQNTRGVNSWDAVSPALVRAQIDAVAEDLFPAAFKTGMLANAAIASAVAAGRISALHGDPGDVSGGARLDLEDSGGDAARPTFGRDALGLNDDGALIGTRDVDRVAVAADVQLTGR